MSLEDRELKLLFLRDPSMIPLYRTIEGMLLKKYPDVQVRMDKSQITFLSEHPMAFVWLPIMKVKGRPEHYLVFSLALNQRIEDPRLLEAVEPYPNHWMHHFLIESEEQIDQSLLDITETAYRFSLR